MNKFIYVCSPYAWNTNYNMENARKYSRFIILSGYIPITPHIYFTQFLSDDIPKERDLGIQVGSYLMDICSEIWVFGNYISRGMKSEIKRAKEMGYKIRYFTTEMEEQTEFDKNNIEQLIR